MAHVLVLAPHPDDEALGCGGTLADHQLRGDTIDIVYLTSGERNDPGRTRESEAEVVCDKLGATPFFWREVDSGLRVDERLITKIRDLMAERHPDLVYAPHREERHGDHRAAYAIASYGVSAFHHQLLEGRTYWPVLSLYEIWTPLLEVKRVVDIEPYRSDKLWMIHTYESQFDGSRFLNHMDDAIFGLNRYRAVVDSGQQFNLVEAFG